MCCTSHRRPVGQIICGILLRWARLAELCLSSVEREADYRVRRRETDQKLLLCVGFNRWDLPADALRRTFSGKHRESNGDDHFGIRGARAQPLPESRADYF